MTLACTNKHLTIVIYNCNDCGLYYTCFMIAIYNLMTVACTVSILQL